MNHSGVRCRSVLGGIGGTGVRLHTELRSTREGVMIVCVTKRNPDENLFQQDVCGFLPDLEAGVIHQTRHAQAARYLNCRTPPRKGHLPDALSLRRLDQAQRVLIVAADECAGGDLLPHAGTFRLPEAPLVGPCWLETESRTPSRAPPASPRARLPSCPLDQEILLIRKMRSCMPPSSRGARRLPLRRSGSRE